MKNKRKLALITMSLLVLVVVFTVGCSSNTQKQEAAKQETTQTVDLKSVTDFADHSLLGYHTADQLASLDMSTCLSCHPDEAIMSATESRLGDGGKDAFNYHAAHVVYQCTDCHDASEEPTLRCNNCHQLDVPEGWQDTTGWGSDEAFGDSDRMFMDPGKIYGDLGYGTSGPSYAMGDEE